MRLEEILNSLIGHEITILYTILGDSEVFSAKGVLVKVDDDYLALRFRERRREFIRLINRRAVVIAELIFEGEEK